MARTEEQQLLKESVKIRLGGTDYEIKPLVLKEAIPWRRKFGELFNSLADLLNVTSDKPDEFKSAMSEVMIKKPEEIMDLFFDYTKLSRKEIEEKATTIELVKALEEVFALEAPFFGAAVRAVSSMKKALQ